MNKQKVFGIGLSRTGTTSLTEALRILGYKSIHFPLSIFKYKNGVPLLNKKFVDKFDSFTDTPVCLVYKQLDEAFPGSKFILTTRDKGSWLVSMLRLNKSHIFLGLFSKIDKLTRDLYGVKSYKNKRQMSQSFDDYHKDVLSYFSGEKRKNLLILDISEKNKWDVLCNFLKCTKPKNIEFPHYHKGYKTSFNNFVDFFKQ